MHERSCGSCCRDTCCALQTQSSAACCAVTTQKHCILVHTTIAGTSDKNLKRKHCQHALGVVTQLFSKNKVFACIQSTSAAARDSLRGYRYGPRSREHQPFSRALWQRKPIRTKESHSEITYCYCITASTSLDDSVSNISMRTRLTL